MSVSNSVCVITGSAQGLGKAFAVRLLTAGAKVCLSDLKQETGEKTLAELRERFGEDKVCFVACNVTVEQDFKNLFDKAEEFFKVSCVDILVNNAGINTNWGWKKCMEVNIMAVMTGTEIAMERMRKFIYLFIYLLRANKQVVEDKVQQIYELCGSSKQSAGLCFHNPSGYNITESPNSS